MNKKLKLIGFAGASLFALTVPMRHPLMAQGMMGPSMMRPGMMRRPVPSGPDASGQTIFAEQCSQCHTLRSDSAGLAGPSLMGVFGRKAGSLPGYDYSSSMRGSGLTWTEKTLDQFLAAPQTYIQGTNMPLPGITDNDARRRLIELLKSAAANPEIGDDNDR